MNMTDNQVIQGSASAGVAALALAGDGATEFNLRQAFDKTFAAAQALAIDELLPVNIDLPSAVNTAVGAIASASWTASPRASVPVEQRQPPWRGRCSA